MENKEVKDLIIKNEEKLNGKKLDLEDIDIKKIFEKIDKFYQKIGECSNVS